MPREIWETGDPGRLPGRVQVYRNLNVRTPDGSAVYSVRDARTRRVVAWVRRIALVDVRFVVSAAGRDRVRAEHCRNVHAVVDGIPVAWETAGECSTPVVYNPYEVDGFVEPGTHDVLVAADWVRVSERGVRARAVRRASTVT